MTTHGAPLMIGCYRGFIALLKKAFHSVFSIHCVIHCQHLVAKKLSDQLNSSLQVVIVAINSIKTRALKDRRQLCHENDEHFERLLLYTEVRWLSMGNCLKPFNEIFVCPHYARGVSTHLLRDTWTDFNKILHDT